MSLKDKTMEPRISIITLGVKDLQRSYEFYHKKLGLSTSKTPDDGIIFFKTSGTCLALYPHDKLAEDVGDDFKTPPPKLSGVTLAHNVREKREVAEVLQQAEDAGATIVKHAQDTFWGGYSGYFSDLDGHLWEIAWGAFDFNDDGSLKIP